MRTFISLVFLASGLAAQDKADLYTINRIKNEAFQNSKVMENAFYLTDVYGPRLTGSPGIQAAAECAVTMEAQDPESAHAPHRAHRTLDRGGTGLARFQGLRERSLRRPRNHDAQ